MAVENCPAERCEDCDFYRTESWCARAIPINQNVYDDKYRAYMEGFWEAIDWCEEHYQWLENHYEKNNDYIVAMEKLIDLCYADGRPPTEADMFMIDTFWSDEE